MRPLIATILIVLFASAAMAQPLVLSQTPTDGVYVLTVKGGQATLEQAIVLIVDGPPTGPPIVQPPVTTDPTDLSSLTTVSQAQYARIPASDVKPLLGATVSTVYRSIAASLRDGSSNVAQAASQVQQIRDVLPADWNAWKAETAKTWNALQDKGLIASPATWAAGLDAIAGGIASQAEVEAFEIGEAFLNNKLVDTLFDILLKLTSESDRPVAKWLPIILPIVKIIISTL
jgi:hypothetical protein